jgi:hypothetical protein
MAHRYLERVRFLTTTVGQGSITVGSPTSTAFNTPAAAGMADADTSIFIIEEGNDYEIFKGTASSTASILSRDTVLQSKIAGVIGTTKMSLLGAAVVRCGLAAAETLIGPQSAVTDSRPALFDGTTGRLLKQHSALLGTAAAANTGTSGATVPLLNAANTWGAIQSFDYPVLPVPFALTTATAWSGATKQALTVNVSGANFAVANPSPVPAAGIFIGVYVSWASAHTLTWGNLFKGITSYVGSGNGKKDHLSFRSNGTQLELVGLTQDIGA